MTIMSATKMVMELENSDMKSVAKAISSGSLRGARGNSGVILSQLLRGFTKTIRDAQEIDSQLFAQACEAAVHTAYKAVMKPKEGTILTVAKGVAKKAMEMAETTDDLEVILPEVIKHGNEVLDYTPELLPVLKEAGVVDSGGQGLMEILQGAYDAFLGKEINYEALAPAQDGAASKAEQPAAADIKFGYCTEFIVLTEKEFTAEDETKFKAYLESIGDSIVCVADDGVVKIHVHTNDPGLAIQRALKYGQLSRIKIDNMREEHEEKLIRDAEKLAAQQQAEAVEKEKGPRKNIGFIAVSIGEGMNDIFRELGVDYLIEGGQTMNPSTDDMLTAIDHVNADHIFILPNNKNIILAANQAQSLTKDKDIIVIPTTTVPQGVAALINYMENEDVDANLENMKEIITNVKTGSVTYAVRDTSINGFDIKENDIMGIGDAGICAVGSDIADTTKNMLKELIDDNSEIVSIFYGADVSEEAATKLTEEVGELFPHVDVDMHFGGQPIYYYITSVE